MAREFGPEGVHVVHVVIDGQIDTQGRGDEDLLDPGAIADAYWSS